MCCSGDKGACITYETATTPIHMSGQSGAIVFSLDTLSHIPLLKADGFDALSEIDLLFFDLKSKNEVFSDFNMQTALDF